MSHPGNNAVIIGPKVNRGIPVLKKLRVHITLNVHKFEEIKLLKNRKSILKILLMVLVLQVLKVNGPHVCHIVLEFAVDILNNTALLSGLELRMSPTWDTR